MTTLNEKVKLLFPMAVPYFLEKARLFYNMLEQDLTDFTAADTTINAAWLAELQAKITAAEKAKDPHQAKTELIGATEEVLALLVDARNSVQELFFFVAKAWPGSRPRLTAYGKDEYRQASRSQTRMALLMEKALGQMSADTAQLDGAGYTQAKRDAFAALLANLEAKIAEQDRNKSLKALVTEEYYSRMNTVWKDMALISALSKIIYTDDYVKRKNYLLHKPRKKKKVETEEVMAEPEATGLDDLPTNGLPHQAEGGNGVGRVSVA